MKISIKPILRKDKINQHNIAPIVLRFTHCRKVKYLALGISVNVDSWNFENDCLIDNYTNYKQDNLVINTKLAEYDKKIRRLQALDIDVTFDTLLNTNSRKSPNQTVSEYFSKLIDGFKKSGKLNTASKYSFCLSSLNKFSPANMTFDKIDKTFLAEFEQYLRDRGLSSNTIATKFTNLKSAYNKALEDGIFVPKDNPFAKYKVGKLWTKTRKRAITKEDIMRLRNLDLSPDRYSDIINGRVQYSRHKTGKVISCQLLPDAQHIMNKYGGSGYNDKDYIFPILDRHTHITEQQIFNRVHKVLIRVNANLKAMSKELNLGIPLTTYVARHTYATVLKRSGVNIAIISESLGHSDLATTQIYLDSFENSQIDEAMKNLL